MSKTRKEALNQAIRYTIVNEEDSVVVKEGKGFEFYDIVEWNDLDKPRPKPLFEIEYSELCDDFLGHILTQINLFIKGN